MSRSMEKEDRIGLLEADASDVRAFDGWHGNSGDAISPDEVEDVLKKLERTIKTEADSDSSGFAAQAATDEDDDLLDEENALDLSAGEQGPDSVSLYLRQIGRVPLLTREGEIVLAKRIEGGHQQAERAITRSPIAIAELLKIGNEVEAGDLNISDVVIL